MKRTVEKSSIWKMYCGKISVWKTYCRKIELWKRAFKTYCGKSRVWNVPWKNQVYGDVLGKIKRLENIL